MEIFLLESDYGQYDEARTYVEGLFSTYEKAEIVQNKIKGIIAKQLKSRNIMKKYNAQEFNFTTIKKYTLDEIKSMP